jgi:hypothetical protein
MIGHAFIAQGCFLQLFMQSAFDDALPALSVAFRVWQRILWSAAHSPFDSVFLVWQCAL